MIDDVMYKQVVGSGVENAMEIAVQVMSTVLDRILLQYEVPTFCSDSFIPSLSSAGERVHFKTTSCRN